MDEFDVDNIIEEFKQPDGQSDGQPDGQPDEQPDELFEYSTVEEDAAAAKAKAEKAAKVRLEIYDWIHCIVTALICGILIFVFVGRTIGVEGSSMRNTLEHHDRVIMHNLFYSPKKGDIVVFQSVNGERFRSVPLVKRVIATAGDSVDIDFSTGNVFINGAIIDEPYIRALTTTSEGFEGPITIPDGFIFVMGDNRNSSKDSRSSDVGLVDTRYVLGRVVFLMFPGDGVDEVRDWKRIGVVK